MLAVGRSFADRRPTIGDVGRRSADKTLSADCRPTIGRLSADNKWLIQKCHRPIIGRLSAYHRPIAKTQKLSADGKKIITR